MSDIFKDISFKKIKELFLDIIFPRFCIGCKAEGVYICKDCEVFFTEARPVCPNCGKVSIDGSSCNSCEEIEGLFSGWYYEGLTKKMIGKIRGGHFHMGEIMIDRLIQAMIQESRFEEPLSFLLDENTKIVYPNKRHTQVLANRIGELTNKKPINKEGELSKQVVFINDLFFSKEAQRISKKLKSKGVERIWFLTLTRKR